MAALACFCVALGVGVDPYRVYGTAEVRGWTALKPRAYEQSVMAKTYALKRVAPVTLLLGNSRVEVGIDPASPQWPAEARPVFNAGHAGTGPETALLMLREAIAVRAPSQVFLALDIQDFLQPATAPGPASAVPIANMRQRWRDWIATTLTIDAELDSLATLIGQDETSGATMTALGFNPKRDYAVYTASNGFGELFAQKTAAYDRMYRQYPHPTFADPMAIESFRTLEQVIAVAAQHRIELTLFVHPYSADYLEMLHRAGLWDSFENWKRALVRVTEAARARSPVALRLFDFSGYDDASTERVPALGDRRTRMRWHWESGHYQSALGERLLSVMLGHRNEDGYLMSSATIEGRIAAIQAARTAYLDVKRTWLDQPAPQAGYSRETSR